MRHLRRLLKIGMSLVGLGMLALALLLGALWAEHTRPLTLPALSGPFPVGRVEYDWTDSARVDPLAPTPGTKRELTVWIWYPADGSRLAGVPRAPYMPAPLRVALDDRSGVLMSDVFTRDLTRVHVHAFEAPPVAPARRRYPVALFKPGIGALALQYTSLAEDLASHGWVVVASDSPYSTAVVVYRDGRVVSGTAAGNPGDGRAAPAEAQTIANRLVGVWAADESFELDQLERLDASDPSGRFTGRLALDSVGAFGHSFGGAAAIQFCRDDPRCAAAVDLDGQPFGDVIGTGTTKPLLVILSEHTDSASSEDQAVRRKIDEVVRRVPNRPAVIEILGSRHFNFSDQAFLKDRRMSRLFNAVGPIGARRGIAVTSAYVRAFFDRWVRGTAPDSLMLAPSARYPEVRVLKR